LIGEVVVRKQTEKALETTSRELDQFFTVALDLLCIADTHGFFLRLNPQWEKTLGYSLAELQGQRFLDLVHPEDLDQTLAAVQTLAGQRSVLNFINRYRCRDGSYRWIEWRSYPAGDKIYAAARDITERKETEAALRDNEERYRLLFEGITDMVFVHGITEDGFPGQFLAVNDSACRRLGYTREELLRMTILDIDAPESAVDVRAIVERLKLGEKVMFEQAHFAKDGRRFPVEINAQSFRFQERVVVFSVVRDITERKRAETERENLQGQLTQAQKMESVGRLAGGVAHDFNNMLQSILGNADLAMLDLPPDSPARESLMEIRRSAERSADLTRQLLAFARKQTIAPRVFDLNDTVAGMLKMLRRLIGEDIDLSWMPGANLWPIKMDPSQIDQVLANLCVNARDAITGAGKVTIETANVVFDGTYASTHLDCVPGQYVMLAVSDTGGGMDAETRSHLFEPFFTTKEIGKGTGLGLATVFGIVKQNHGLINVYTEPGHGTTFKLYLPRSEAPVAPLDETPSHAQRGTETVMLVEDEEQILNLGRRILEQHGYTVLAAPTPAAALALAAQQVGTIHLLITDVVMPGMNGKELDERLRASHPALKCLFMSGYTANVIAHHGVLDEGVQFLQKPFTARKLTAKVREVLDRDFKPDRPAAPPGN
jgi:PAS domain S-box-containing protein